MTRLGATGMWIVLVLASVASHLGEGAACAPEGAAEVLASNTTLFWDGVLVPDRLTSFAETINGPKTEEKGTNRFHNRNRNRYLGRFHAQSCKLEGGGEDGVRSKEHQNHLECVLCRDSLARLSEPSKRHASHDLRLQDLVAPYGATKRGVTDSDGKTVEQSILP